MTDEEHLRLLQTAEDDILAAMRQHGFGIALYAALMNVAVMFRFIDELDPPPDVKCVYAELQAQIEMFVRGSYTPLLQVIAKGKKASDEDITVEERTETSN